MPRCWVWLSNSRARFIGRSQHRLPPINTWPVSNFIWLFIHRRWSAVSGPRALYVTPQGAVWLTRQFCIKNNFYHRLTSYEHHSHNFSEDISRIGFGVASSCFRLMSEVTADFSVTGNWNQFRPPPATSGKNADGQLEHSFCHIDKTDDKE